MKLPIVTAALLLKNSRKTAAAAFLPAQRHKPAVPLARRPKTLRIPLPVCWRAAAPFALLLKNSRKTAAAFALLSSLATLMAQTQDISTQNPDRTISVPVGFPGSVPNFTIVRDLPFSAQEIIEHTQTLPDGTHITQKPRKEEFYRDSAGRTRTERAASVAPNISSEPPLIVDIRDPVAGYQYILDEEHHVAHRTKLSGSALQNNDWVTARVRQAQQPIIRNGRGMSSSQEPLGSQVMEGVHVVGYRMTTVIQTNTQGNDAPITTTQEAWFSPQIGENVLFKMIDPRSGESTVRLTNIVASEPDPTLFQVPPNYEIVDESGPFKIRLTMPAAR